MESETKITYPDYKAIREQSCYYGCTITEADFNTNRPNPNRIKVTAGDINRYFKGGKRGRL